MKALITGATGFIGSHLVDRLVERDDTVRALVRPSSDVSYLEERGVELVRGDITDAASLAAAVAGIDVVYHAAAQGGDGGPGRRGTGRRPIASALGRQPVRLAAAAP